MAKKSFDSDYINQLYDSGLSTYQIAAKFGCSDETIRKRIKVKRTLVQANLLRSPETNAKIAKSCAEKWQDDSYRTKVLAATATTAHRMKLAQAGRNSDALVKWTRSEVGKAEISRRVKLKWTDQEYRDRQSVYYQSRVQRISQAARIALQDPTSRAAWIDKLRKTSAERESNGFVSSSQRQLYYILNMSDIIFYEEGNKTRVGPYYVVDCIIPKQQNMTKDLVVEVQGEYWHSLKHVVVKDQQKKTYIKNHTDYDLLYIDELDLSSCDEVVAKLNNYGLQVKVIDTSVGQLEIRRIAESDAQLFYSIFHYSKSIRHGAITFGAYCDGVMVAAISYTYPIREQIAASMNLELKELMEISRLARCTNVKCKNLISWLIGKTRTKLPESVTTIISYADETYGHSGAVYKAAGFINDKIVDPDYHYVSINGKYHKKTIWDMAKRMKMTEPEYAAKHNLAKVYGQHKHRWVYRLIN